MAMASIPESSYVMDPYGGITIPEAAAAVEIACRRDRVAKRGREESPPLAEESDTFGWSSAVLERGLALRRRQGPSSFSHRGGVRVVGAATVATTQGEHTCAGGLESSTSDDARAEEAVEEAEIENSYLGHLYLNVIYY